jgi:XTP/dITP diphosphohydrolase
LDKPTTHQIVAATSNQHKLSEIRPLLEPDFRILSLHDIGYHKELAETGDTLEANSLQKAKYIHDHFNLPCFADDTGLEVEALDGEPGVYSARYAGYHRNSHDNISLLLKKLSGKENRRARFRTVITLLGLKGVHVFEGTVHGTITETAKGTGGFGYDPVFQPDATKKTMAELTLEEKNAISHRGEAVKKLVAFLKTQN